MKPQVTIQHLQQLQAAGKIRGFVAPRDVHDNDVGNMPKKKAKYRNNKVVVDGIEFDSEKEAARYGVLKLRLKAGDIGMLQLQVVYDLNVNGKRVCRYIADFQYIETATGNTIVEDVKSVATRKVPVYRLKKKLMKQIHNIEIREV
jgi:hypothetical protein